VRNTSNRAVADRDCEDERGAVIIMVALLMVVFLGMAALVVDVGAAYVERRQLQNGADAGALAVARSCALGACGAMTTTALGLANANSEDGTSAIDSVVVNATARTATVITSTRLPNGTTAVPFTFAPVLGVDSAHIDATAVAAWGPPKRATAVALAMSACDFVSATSNGSSFTPLGPPWPALPVTIVFHVGNGNAAPGTCNEGPAGQFLSGGFGWLDNTTGCNVGLTRGAVATEQPGNAPHNGCAPADLLRKIVQIPIYDVAGGSGNNGTFHIKGFAAFYVTGFSFPGSGWSNTTCGVSASCIKGFFTTFVFPQNSGVDPLGQDLGGRAVSLIS
jgi:Flp pilus assembly protein TadG